MDKLKQHLHLQIEELKKEIKKNIASENYDTALNLIIKLKGKQDILKEL